MVDTPTMPAGGGTPDPVTPPVVGEDKPLPDAPAGGDTPDPVTPVPDVPVTPPVGGTPPADPVTPPVVGEDKPVV